MILTLIGSLFKAVIYLLKHGLAATLEHRENNALESVFVGCLDRTLHGFSCGSANGISSVLSKKKSKESKLLVFPRVRKFCKVKMLSKIYML